VVTVLTAALSFTPLEAIKDPIITIEEGVIRNIASRRAAEIPAGARVVDFPGAVLAPGFIDIHIHGGAGYDVMQAETGAPEGFERLLAAHGVTSYLPTTVTAPIDQTLKSLEKLAKATEAAAIPGKSAGRAQPLGIHLEGPFISHAKRGVHPAENILPPSVQAFDRFWEAARGRIKMMTLAPELPGMEQLIGEARHREVRVSLGHSNADLRSARAAVEAGATHAAHTFNAMRSLQHRDPGILGVVLTDSRLTADIIADGVHVDPVVIELFLRAKGPEAAVLITDAISATGMPEGRYRLGSLEVEVQGTRCFSEGRLAGSVLTLDRAVRNIMKFANWGLRDAVRLATLNPARVLGVASRKGALLAGCDADIVVLSGSGEVVKTMVRGAGI